MIIKEPENINIVKYSEETFYVIEKMYHQLHVPSLDQLNLQTWRNKKISILFG